MTRNYPIKGPQAPAQGSLEEGQPPPYTDVTAGDTFPPRYSDTEDLVGQSRHGEPDAYKNHRTEALDPDGLNDPARQNRRIRFKRSGILCLVVFALLLGVRLTIPVVIGSRPYEPPTAPPSNQKPIAPPPNPPTSNPSRETYIFQTSNSINGLYSLLDLLSITTTSGSINVGVSPQPIDSSNPKPASLIIKSNSGSIDANLPLAAGAGGGGGGIPERDYRTEIETRSGSINGNFLLGSRTVFETRSGSLDLAFLPVIPSNGKMEFRTRTASGTHNIKIKSPLLSGQDGASTTTTHRGGAIKGLVSTHASNSGTFGLHYPREWEGEIDIRTGSGSINVGGEGVRVLEQGRGFLRAVKGDGSGEGRISVSGGSGSVNLRIG
ncbi:MAG: hypothetical protein M1836_007326 [Candelina mexicana]|nr:MAG: hypothetical protein M1836_007326 [Candelina mexicana]